MSGYLMHSFINGSRKVSGIKPCGSFKMHMDPFDDHTINKEYTNSQLIILSDDCKSHHKPGSAPWAGRAENLFAGLISLALPDPMKPTGRVSL